MNRILLLKRLEKAAALMRRAGLGGLVDRVRGRALDQLGTFTVVLEGVTLTGDTAAHSNYVRELGDQGREGFLLDLWRAAAQPGALVVDVGAYLGLLTLIAARNGADVVAFEPNPKTLPFLKRNLELNGVQVRLVERAVAAEAGTRTFFLDEGGDTSGLHRQAGSREQITIETVVADDELGGRPVAAIKIDVEGAELEALAGLERTIAGSPGVQLFVEANPSALEAAGASERALIERLEGLGFEVLTIDEAARALTPYAGVGNLRYLNVLARRR